MILIFSLFSFKFGVTLRPWLHYTLKSCYLKEGHTWVHKMLLTLENSVLSAVISVTKTAGKKKKHIHKSLSKPNEYLLLPEQNLQWGKTLCVQSPWPRLAKALPSSPCVFSEHWGNELLAVNVGREERKGSLLLNHLCHNVKFKLLLPRPEAINACTAYTVGRN